MSHQNNFQVYQNVKSKHGCHEFSRVQINCPSTQTNFCILPQIAKSKHYVFAIFSQYLEQADSLYTRFSALAKKCMAIPVVETKRSKFSLLRFDCMQIMLN